MKNRLIDLNNHLFLALDRLNDESLTPEQIEIESKRAKSITDLGDKIIDIAKTSLEAEKLKADYLGASSALPVYFNNTDKLEVKNA